MGRLGRFSGEAEAPLSHPLAPPLLLKGGWCDAYCRPTSPRCEAKRECAKPSPSMKGHLVSPQQYTRHPTVSVDGHLPSGWGRLVLMSGASHAAYNTSPGDTQRVPAAAIAMEFCRLFRVDAGGTGTASWFTSLRPTSTSVCPTPLLLCCRLERRDRFAAC